MYNGVLARLTTADLMGSMMSISFLSFPSSSFSSFFFFFSFLPLLLLLFSFYGTNNAVLAGNFQAAERTDTLHFCVVTVLTYTGRQSYTGRWEYIVLVQERSWEEGIYWLIFDTRKTCFWGSRHAPSSEIELASFQSCQTDQACSI